MTDLLSFPCVMPHMKPTPLGSTHPMPAGFAGPVIQVGSRHVCVAIGGGVHPENGPQGVPNCRAHTPRASSKKDGQVAAAANERGDTSVRTRAVL